MDKMQVKSSKGNSPKYCIYIIGLFLGVSALLNISTSGSSLRGNLKSLLSTADTEAKNEEFQMQAEIEYNPNSGGQEEEGSVLEVLPTDRIMTSDDTQWDRSPIVVEEFRLIFFSIPKVACTTWKQLFRRIMGKSDWQSQNEGLPHDPKFNNLIYLHTYKNLTQVQQMFLNPNWTKAIFVREPKQRLLSGYLDKAVSNDGRFVRDKCCAKIPRVRPKCHKIPTCRKCFEDARSNLTSFLQLIHTCRDDHWEPQAARMDAKYWKYINFVGKMDTLAEDGIRLMERIGAWEKYGKDGWGPHGNGSMFVSSKRQTHTTNANSKMQAYFYPELEKQAEDFYHEDYDHPLFGFTKKNVTSG